MSSVEVVAVNEVAAFLVNVDDNVDLVSSVDVLLFDSSVGNPDESSFFMKSGIGRLNGVVSQPGEVVVNEFVCFLEGFELVEFLDLLPFFV